VETSFIIASVISAILIKGQAGKEHLFEKKIQGRSGKLPYRDLATGLRKITPESHAIRE
jgi:hypothetical protein